jgi:hypothetical protein
VGLFQSQSRILGAIWQPNPSRSEQRDLLYFCAQIPDQPIVQASEFDQLILQLRETVRVFNRESQTGEFAGLGQVAVKLFF